MPQHRDHTHGKHDQHGHLRGESGISVLRLPLRQSARDDDGGERNQGRRDDETSIHDTEKANKRAEDREQCECADAGHPILHPFPLQAR